MSLIPYSARPCSWLVLELAGCQQSTGPWQSFGAVHEFMADSIRTIISGVEILNLKVCTSDFPDTDGLLSDL